MRLGRSFSFENCVRVTTRQGCDYVGNRYGVVFHTINDKHKVVYMPPDVPGSSCYGAVMRSLSDYRVCVSGMKSDHSEEVFLVDRMIGLMESVYCIGEELEMPSDFMGDMRSIVVYLARYKSRLR